MPEARFAGWDLGGAHLKLAVAGRAPDETTHLIEVVQVPCALWRGLDRIEGAIAEVEPHLSGAGRHAVTMTGELADLFEDRSDGVRRLVETMRRAFPEDTVEIYAGRSGLVAPAEAVERPLAVASANWLAAAELTARRISGGGILLDIGSTTSDIVPFAGGTVRADGTSDAERLASNELVYSGVVRTPVMAVAVRLPFAGTWQGVMAEHFATLADVYRLTGELPENADQHPSADGRDKSVAASARRLARMLGRDAADAETEAWRGLARVVAERQRRRIRDALDRVASRAALRADAPLVGAGVGRFLVRRLAEESGRPYVDFAELLEANAGIAERAARCAPAAALALLAAEAR